MAANYQHMYEQKCRQFQELNQQFNEYQQQSNLIIADLEEEVKELKKRHDTQARELNELKEKRKNFNNTYEKEIEQTRREREQFRTKFIDFEKKVIELENINEALESELRAAKASLHEYEQRTEKTMEQLAFLQVQMEESTETNQEQIARLRSQLKETEEELFAWQHKIQLNEKNREGKENNEESFLSRHSTGKKSEPLESKIKTKKHSKFNEVLGQIRSYVLTISARREEIGRRIDQL